MANVGSGKSFARAAKRIMNAAKKIDEEALPKFMRSAAEEIMTDVKASRKGRGVPRRDGILASTGAVAGPLVKSKPVVVLSFGGASAPYALAQHENTGYRHTLGEARYLVRGMERWKPGGSAALEALRQNAQEALGGDE